MSKSLKNNLINNKKMNEIYTIDRHAKMHSRLVVKNVRIKVYNIVGSIRWQLDPGSSLDPDIIFTLTDGLKSIKIRSISFQ